MTVNDLIKYLQAFAPNAGHKQVMVRDDHGILDILQFNFLRAFSGLPYIGWDL